MSASVSSDTRTSTRGGSGGGGGGSGSGSGGDSRFGCNICLEAVAEPVVTICGHLYCWPCLYRWLEPGLTSDELQSLGVQSYRSLDASRRTCPVCKASCSVATVVPIYVRSHAQHHHNHAPDDQSRQKSVASTLSSASASAAPAPQPQPPDSSSAVRRRLRFRSVPNRPAYSPSLLSSLPLTPSRSLPPPAASLSTGLALSLQQALFGNNSSLDASSELQPQYDPATEFLSRVLLMLGSFVILCLLLF